MSLDNSSKSEIRKSKNEKFDELREFQEGLYTIFKIRCDNLDYYLNEKKKSIQEISSFYKSTGLSFITEKDSLLSNILSVKVLLTFEDEKFESYKKWVYEKHYWRIYEIEKYLNEYQAFFNSLNESDLKIAEIELAKAFKITNGQIKEGFVNEVVKYIQSLFLDLKKEVFLLVEKENPETLYDLFRVELKEKYDLIIDLLVQNGMINPIDKKANKYWGNKGDFMKLLFELNDKRYLKYLPDNPKQKLCILSNSFNIEMGKNYSKRDGNKFNNLSFEIPLPKDLI